MIAYQNFYGMVFYPTASATENTNAFHFQLLDKNLWKYLLSSLKDSEMTRKNG